MRMLWTIAMVGALYASGEGHGSARLGQVQPDLNDQAAAETSGRFQFHGSSSAILLAG